jgi:conjugal transfer/type IV secretion protein DotA/TraY
MMPEILPRIRAIGLHFGHFAYLIALVFSSARLIPVNHPSLNPVNIGQFSVRQVIAIAANNITWSRNNIDQIGIFAAIVIGLIIIVIQALLIAFAALAGFGNEASASSFFTTPEPKQDPMMEFFAHVFGFLDGFWGINPGDVRNEIVNGNVIEVPVGPIADSKLHAGIYAMLRLYSMATMVIAVIIIIYYIMTVVAETAQTGQPFGRRFNTVWAPIRLVLALGLLVPLGTGLNSAQYITLWLAKMGSGLGTQVWGVMHEAMGQRNVEDIIIGEFANQWVHEAAFRILFMETCMYASNKEMYKDPLSENGIRRRVVEEDNSDDNRVFKVFYDKPSSFGGTLGVGNLIYRSCGEITLTINSQDTDSIILQANSLPVETAYQMSVTILKELMGELDGVDTQGKFVPETALSIARQNISNGGYAAPDGFQYNNVIIAAENVKNSVLVDTATEDFKNETQQQLQALFDEADNSFIYAGVWYLELARIIQQSKDILSSSVPNFHTLETHLRGEVQRTATGQTLSQHVGYAVNVGNETETVLINLWPDIAEYINEYNVNDNAATPLACRNLGHAPDWYVSAACLVGAIIVPDQLVILSQSDPATRSLNPMATLINAGYEIFQKSWWAIGTGLVANTLGGILAVFGPLTSVLGVVMSSLGSIAILIGALGLTAGIILYFLLPLLPFLYFFFAVVSWIMEIFEAVIAMPLWALSFLKIEGDGFPGPSAVNGFFLLLSILIRPALIVIGLVAGVLIFTASIYLLQILFDSVLIINGSGNSNGLENLFFALIFAYTTYTAGITSFKLVDKIPNQILRWIGSGASSFSDGNDVDMGGNTQMLGAAGAFLGGSVANSISSNAGGLGQAIGRGFKSDDDNPPPPGGGGGTGTGGNDGNLGPSSQPEPQQNPSATPASSPTAQHQKSQGGLMQRGQQSKNNIPRKKR